MNRKRFTHLPGRAIGLLAGGILLGGAMLTSAVQADEPIAAIGGNSDVYWEMTTQRNYYRAVLTVMGPDGYSFDGEFDGAPYLNGPLADGLYKYELYLMPYGQAVAATKRPGAQNGPIDSNGRPAAASRAMVPDTSGGKRGRVQSGTFAIDGGLRVNPDAAEG